MNLLLNNKFFKVIPNIDIDIDIDKTSQTSFL
jgi:hypothetical protein